jgi:hypothetical protein
MMGIIKTLEEFKFLAQSVRKPSGYFVLNGEQIADTVQCGHCQKHWVPMRGSGIRRGWCMNCGKPTCGSQQCDNCIPAERKLELIEKGINPRQSE